MPHPNGHTDNSRKQFERHFGKKIEDYEAIKKAVSTVGEQSRYNYYCNLPNYFMFLNEDPDTVIKNRRKHLKDDDPDTLEYYEQKTKQYIQQLKDKGLAGRGIESLAGRIQGFFTHNSKRYSLDMGNLRISKARKRRKYSPSNEEVRELIGWCDNERDKLIVCVAYQLGAAPVDISLLRCGDLPLAPFEYFEKERSKTGEVWRGVTTPDLIEHLTAYLKLRGNPAGKELLFKSREGYLDNEGISGVIASAISKSKLATIPGVKPTSLRDAFEDALVDAGVKTKIKEALMAHNSAIEQEYGGYNKMVQNLVEAVKQVYPFIALRDQAINGALAGFSKEDVEKLKELLPHIDDLSVILEAVHLKQLVHIDDPDLIERLRKAGKIP